MEGVFVNQPNVQLIYETMARITGRKYGAQITVTVRPKVQKERSGETLYVGEVKEKPPPAV